MALERGLSGRRVDFYGCFHDRRSVSPIKSSDNDTAASEEYMFLKYMKAYASHTYRLVDSMNTYCPTHYITGQFPP